MADTADDIFYTVSRTGSGKLREKMSSFLGFAHHVETADEARALVKQYQNEYHDARHVCWAYMLGPQRLEHQLNDNGEPSGTAGKPILGQINSAGITDVVVIVVRYFGGIKLGTSGLITAYREAARLAIEDGAPEERRVMAKVVVRFPYLVMNDVMRVAKTPGVSVVDQQFDNNCEMTLAMRKGLTDGIIARLQDIDSTEVNP